MWQVASHISTAASINSSTNTCKPKQMGQTGSFPPHIKVLTCGPHEVTRQHQRHGETIKTHLQRDRIAQKRKMSSRGSQYIFFIIHPAQSVTWMSSKRRESAVPIPNPLNFSTAILIIMVVQKGNLPLLFADLEWADGEILIVLFEFPPFYGSLKSWVKSFVLFGYQKGKQISITLV